MFDVSLVCCVWCVIGSGSCQEWATAAKTVWDACGVPWIEPTPEATKMFHVGRAGLSPELEDSNPWYAMLPSREKFNLKFVESVFPKAAPTDCRAYVLSRSFARTSHESRMANRTEPNPCRPCA